MHVSPDVRRAGAVLLSVAVLACGDEAGWERRGEPWTPPMAAALPVADSAASPAFIAAFGAASPALTADQVVSIVRALHRATILAADVAEVRAADGGALRLAERVRAQALADDRRLDRAVASLGLSAMPSQLEDRVRRDAEARLAALRAQPVAGFDTVYLDHVAVAQARAAELLTLRLIPAAQPVALRALLGELLHGATARLAEARAERAGRRPPGGTPLADAAR